MQKNNTLKGLLAVSAVAAMFSAFGVHAQTASSSAANATPSQTGTSSTNPNMAGKTTREGTMDNTNSTGMENRTNAATGAAGMTGHSMGSQGATGSGQTASGAAAGATGTAAAAGSAKLSAGDEKAVKDMALADMAEVATGKLALSKSQNSEVKAYAQQMVDDHGAALTKVQAVAQSKGVTLPTELDAKHKAMSAKLEKLSGDAFDKAYMAGGGVKDHQDTHKKLMADAKKIKDADVKALADQHMPVVEQHLKAAQQSSLVKSGTAAGK
jgi:predicted outer membrane protein